jgi:hypothetical protein
MNHDRLTAEELTNLVRRVFEPRPEDRALAVIVDLPDDEVPDTDRWRERRSLAAGWVHELAAARSEHGLEVSLFLYPNVHSNNADLPSLAWRWSDDTVPDHVEDMTGQLEEPMEQVLSSHPLVIAPTQFSTTAPLKMMAPRLLPRRHHARLLVGDAARPAPRLHRDQPAGVAPQRAAR